MPYPISGTPHPAGSAAANPAYAGKFIPEHWSKKLGEKLYASTILARVTNMTWGEDVKGSGDSIVVRFPPTITISPYEATQVLAFQRPSSAVVRIPINKGWYFNTILDDVMETQSDLTLLDIWAEGASNDMRVQLEAFFLPLLASSIDAANSGAAAGKYSQNINLGTVGAPVPITGAGATGGDTPVGLLAKMAQVLDEQGVSPVGRFAIVPPWYAAALESTPNVIGASPGGWESGMVGRVARFDVYSSVHVSAVAADQPIIAGQRNAVAFASQLSTLEVVRRTDTFASVLRGLQVAGMATMVPTSLTVAYPDLATGGMYDTTGVANDLLPVTPSDATVLPANSGFRVRVAGDVVFTPIGTTSQRTLTGLTAGTIIVVAVSKINTGTTATVDLLVT